MRIGVDLGGTKIEAVVMDDQGGIVMRQRVPTPRGDYQATLDTVVGLVAYLEGVLGVRASVGVGAPGGVSSVTGRIKNSNSVCLNDQPLQQDLEQLLGRSIRVANDANCLALSEAMDGAGVGAEVVFGVIVGTGTGAGIVVGGRLLAGANAIAGEWGHNPLPWPEDDERPGPPCYCGKHGCIETFLSGPGLADEHWRRTGRRDTAEGIVAAAQAGDAAAQRTMERYEDRMARGLASVINVLDPQVIVLGGGVSNIARLYDNVPARWARYVFSDQVNTRLLRARHGDSSGVRGAAWLWPA